MYASKIVETDSLRSNVMNSIMTALAERSSETEEHVMRMKRVAVGIAEQMGLGRSRVESVLAAHAVPRHRQDGDSRQHTV